MELIARLKGHRVWPYWSRDQWPNTLVGHIGLIETLCTVCGQRTFQPRLFEVRQAMPGDESLPALLTLEAYVSPTGYSWELSPYAIVGVRTGPHYYFKDHTIVWALLSPDAQWYCLETKRYHCPSLWPWWEPERGSGVLLTQEDTTCGMYWLVGRTLPLPESKVIIKNHHHHRCGGGGDEKAPNDED